MKSRRNPQFRATYDRLPHDVKQRMRASYRIFKENPYHPGLQFKQVHASKQIYLVRIGLYYRTLGILRDDLIVWFWIGSRAE